MSTHAVKETDSVSYESGYIPGQKEGTGSFIKMIHGEAFIDQHQLALRLIDEINKSPQQLTPMARAAFDAKSVLDENLRGLGGMMEDFRAKLKIWLDDVRVTRMNFVSETTQIMNPLKDVWFFLAPLSERDQWLGEFVEPCERLQTREAAG
jgi:hypothetical protein